MSANRDTRAFTTGKLLFAITVPGSALAVGTLHMPSLIVLTIVASLSTCLLWWRPPRTSTRPARTVLIGAFLLLVATSLQAVPMPDVVTSVLAPGNAEVWEHVFSALREPGPTWHPLSVAPVSTHIEIVRGLFYACVFLAALRISLANGGLRFLEGVVITSACAVAVSTLGHSAVHAHRVFGLYAPREAQGYAADRLGPILNPNHVAAYCNVGALVAAGLALREREIVPRTLGGTAALLLSGTSVWAASRGGTGSLVFGMIVLVGLASYRRRHREIGRGADIAFVGLALVATSILVGVAASEHARGDLAVRDLSKVETIRRAFLLVPVSPIFGIGRGAFETMFPLVYEGNVYFTFVRPENIVAQWCIEWGLPIALAAFAVFAVSLRPKVVLQSERPSLGGWVAIMVAVCHDFVDFHLEVPGVVVLVLACVAVVVARTPSGSDRRSRTASVRLPRTLAFVFGGSALVGSLMLVTDVGHTLSEERDRIASLAVDRTVGSEEFLRELRAAMTRYPAEPYFPLAGAVHAQLIHDGSALPWVARALVRYPAFGRAHLVLARELAARHRAQARLEYRLAYIHDASIRSNIERESLRLVDDDDSAMELVVDGPAGNEMIEFLASHLADRLPATAWKLDDRLLAADSAATGPIERRIHASITDIANAHPWCEDGECLARGTEAAESLIARDPTKCESHMLLARLGVAAGRARAALDRLSSSLDVVSNRGECLRALVSMSIQTGDRRRADTALEGVTRFGCGRREECIELNEWAASIEQSRGNRVRAIAFLKRVAELEPENDAALQRLAEAAEQAGLVGEAVEAYQKLAARHPEDSRWRAHAEELRAASHGRQLPP